MKEVKLISNRKFAAFIPRDNQAWESQLRKNPKMKYARVNKVLIEDNVEFNTIFPAKKLSIQEVVTVN